MSTLAENEITLEIVSDGEDGTDGQDGKSAYQAYAEKATNPVTEDEFNQDLVDTPNKANTTYVDEAAEEAGKTATSYITDASTGIKVHPENDDSNRVEITSDGMSIVKDDAEIASFESDTISLCGGIGTIYATSLAEHRITLKGERGVCVGMYEDQFAPNGGAMLYVTKNIDDDDVEGDEKFLLSARTKRESLIASSASAQIIGYADVDTQTSSISLAADTVNLAASAVEINGESIAPTASDRKGHARIGDLGIEWGTTTVTGVSTTAKTATISLNYTYASAPMGLAASSGTPTSAQSPTISCSAATTTSITVRVVAESSSSLSYAVQWLVIGKIAS